MAVPKLELVLYHWSPVDRRKGIQRYGLRPGVPSLQGDWRPPHVCFSDEPLLAWFLSGRIHPEVENWDLWMVFGDDVGGRELIFDHYTDTGRAYVKEYRVYERIPKSKVHWLGSRSEADRPRSRISAA